MVDLNTSWHALRGRQYPVDADVICTPTVLNPVTAACLAQYAPLADIRPITPDDKYGMWDHMTEYWNTGRTLVHVDHDMVFVWDNLSRLVKCEKPWCICPAWSLGVHVTIGLGLVKFAPQLRAAVPYQRVRDAMEACHCEGMWWHVEYHLGTALLEAGYEPHQHEDVLHDHTERLAPRQLSPSLEVSIPDETENFYTRDYFEERADETGDDRPRSRLTMRGATGG